MRIVLIIDKEGKIMALTLYQYTSDGGTKGTLYVDPAKLPLSLTPQNLGLTAADGTEVKTIVFRKTTRTRGTHARQVTLKGASDGKYHAVPCGTVAAYNAIVTGSTYRVTLKRGEVQNL